MPYFSIIIDTAYNRNRQAFVSTYIIGKAQRHSLSTDVGYWISWQIHILSFTCLLDWYNLHTQDILVWNYISKIIIYYKKNKVYIFGGGRIIVPYLVDWWVCIQRVSSSPLKCYVSPGSKLHFFKMVGVFRKQAPTLWNGGVSSRNSFHPSEMVGVFSGSKLHPSEMLGESSVSKLHPFEMMGVSSRCKLHSSEMVWVYLQEASSTPVKWVCLQDISSTLLKWWACLQEVSSSPLKWVYLWFF